ncbi:conserved hypothetical protein [uncultured Defluviicoccus sp.]|uniref:Uncharacterized protein n=1 Tax=metagenome TaxID=256318 RepID=A0A380THU7_9ZZZZ|nr:conserved hypothetical protein [uncultured Defluviicoccus sp.]
MGVLSEFISGSAHNLRGLFGTSVRARETQETLELLERVRRLRAASPLGDVTRRQLIGDIVASAFDLAGVEPLPKLQPVLMAAAAGIVDSEGILDLPVIPVGSELPLEEGARIREELRHKERLFADPKRIDLWFSVAHGILGGLLKELPPSALTPEEDGAGEAIEACLIDLIEDPGQAVQSTLATLFDDEVQAAGLFATIRHRLFNNLYRASGIDPDKAATTQKEVIPPSEAKGKTTQELVDGYLGGTPYADYLQATLPFPIPLSTRFEHTHILGGTGHGKTQLLQRLIYRDLKKLQEGKGSLCLLDSQGDMIRTLTHLAEFDRDAPNSLADRLVLIDPTDIEHPACLNMFDTNLERLRGYGAAEREMILNGTVALYEYMFGALLGAELTQKQGVIFRYLARLMMVIPDATIHTLRELMEEPGLALPHLGKLEGTAQRFFQREFPDRNFDDTRRQILNRLWGVLSNPVLERLFSNPRNKVDLFQAMNGGKVVLINTAKDLLKRDGCQILGRFFIAMIAQAALERAAIPPERRRATFVYVDEAQEYFDEEIEDLLNQARKYKVGMVLAHQNLEQLSQRLRGTIMASTSIKLAGGVSAKDAALMAKEMRCEPDFVQGMRKRQGDTEFACWIKHATPHAIKATVPLGSVERLPKLSDDAHQALIAANRKSYCADAKDAAESILKGARPANPGAFQLGEHEVL